MNNLKQRLLALSLALSLTIGALAGCGSAPTADAESGSAAKTAVTVQSGVPEVSVTGGNISGYYNEDGNIAIYKGIPYAAAPVDELRWKDPQPVESWNGTKECTEFGNSEVQELQVPTGTDMWTEEYYIENKPYSEDCLTLNVWSKDDSITDKPVLVYIHGGGNKSGGSSCPVYDGEYIASQDVVYVSINYRVGIFGFFAHPELTNENGSSGNYGIKDQLYALQWVQDNIKAFGGNPDNVTIMGQSAGAIDVYALTTSPKSKGLFSKAIAMSFPITMKYPLSNLSDYEKQCQDATENKSLDELMDMSAEDLLALGYNGASCIDDNILVADYKNSILHGANDIGCTMITGFVANDADVFEPTNFETVEEYNDYFSKTYGEEVLDLYPATEDTLREMTMELQNDDYLAQLNLLAEARNENYAGKTYLYKMTQVMSGPESDIWGSFHSSDVPYMLNYFDPSRDEYWTQDDYDFGSIASGFLLDFCKTGTPSIDGVAWNPSEADCTYLNLNVNSQIETLSSEKIEFWSNYYQNLLSE